MPKVSAMSRTENTPQPVTAYAATADGHQAGARSVNADRLALNVQYEELRQRLVDLQCAVRPDMGAIDRAVRSLEMLQLDIKATHGLIGNNPIED